MTKVSDALAANNAASAYAAQKAATGKADETKQAAKSGGVAQTKNYGATIGKPELSEEGAKYYEELKKKYKGMDFVLVSKDMIEMAKGQASSYGNKNRMVVLIDEEKIEKMATDEAYRKKYEGLIATAQDKMPQLQQMMNANSSVKTIGMQVGKDGRASFFAVMDQSAKDFQSKIEAKRAAKKEAAKKEAKAEAKEKQQERLEEGRKSRAEASKARLEKLREGDEDEDYEILQANSIEELMKMIDDWTYNYRSDNVVAKAETFVGQSVDYRG